MGKVHWTADPQGQAAQGRGKGEKGPPNLQNNILHGMFREPSDARKLP